ncbi:MAG: ABC transporter permease [Acetivibrionales bacterium]
MEQTDGLSSAAMQIQISGDVDETNDIQGNDPVIELIDHYNTDFVLFKDYPINAAKGIYFKGADIFQPDIVEGRNFNKADFEQKTKTVLINEQKLSNCFYENDKRFIFFENEKYEVIGVFRNEMSTYLFSVVQATDYYFNLAAIQANKKNSFYMGSFLLDAGGETAQICDALKRFIQQRNENLNVELHATNLDMFKAMKNVMQSRYPIFASFILAVLLLCLNIFSATTYWLSGRKSEISIRRLTGATMKKVGSLLYKDYLFLTTLGYLFGLSLAFVVLFFNLIPYLGETSLDFRSILIAFVIFQLMGSIFGLIALKKHFGREIAQSLR